MVRPLYQEALTKWVGQIPDDVIGDMANIAPMLATLGYDPAANPPTYAIPENEPRQQLYPEEQRQEQQEQQQEQQQLQQEQQQYDTSAGDEDTNVKRKRKRR